MDDGYKLNFRRYYIRHLLIILRGHDEKLKLKFKRLQKWNNIL